MTKILETHSDRVIISRQSASLTNPFITDIKITLPKISMHIASLENGNAHTGNRQ